MPENAHNLIAAVTADVPLTLTTLETLCAEDALPEEHVARLQQFAMAILKATV